MVTPTQLVEAAGRLLEKRGNLEAAIAKNSSITFVNQYGYRATLPAEPLRRMTWLVDHLYPKEPISAEERLVRAERVIDSWACEDVQNPIMLSNARADSRRQNPEPSQTAQLPQNPTDGSKAPPFGSLTMSRNRFFSSRHVDMTKTVCHCEASFDREITDLRHCSVLVPEPGALPLKSSCLELGAAYIVFILTLGLLVKQFSRLSKKSSISVVDQFQQYSAFQWENTYSSIYKKEE